MPTTPEDYSRKTIDRLLEQAGWTLFDRDNADINSHLGTIIRQYPLTNSIVRNLSNCYNNINTCLRNVDSYVGMAKTVVLPQFFNQ